MQSTQQTVVVSGNTFSVKDRLKKAGFRFRRTNSSNVLRDDIDAGFRGDTPIWYAQTDDVAAVLDVIRNLDADVRVKVDGKGLDSADDAPKSASLPMPPASFVPDTDDHLFDGAPMHGIR